MSADRKGFLGSKLPRICLSLTERTIGEDLAIVERERGRVDLVEVRADFLDAEEISHLAAFPERAGLPAILAFRRESDGGVRTIEEAERIALLDRALAGEWAYVDLEHDLEDGKLEQRAVETGSEVIRSLHDFEGVPDRLAARIDGLARTAREIPKAAVMPRTTAGLLEVLEASEQIHAARAIVVAMGEWGFPSRVLPSRFSSVLTYSTAGRLQAAPGHVTPEILRSIYRVGELDESPTIYGVIGNPVLHSRSPWIHNPALRSLGLNAVYIPIPVDDLSTFAELADRLPIGGASVTVPHKEAVRALLSAVDPSVDSAGACNTLVRGGGGWRGYNTDIAGFLEPLRDRAATDLSGLATLVVGAGGAARAVVAGLRGEGARVTIVNRSADRARALASQFDCDRIDISEVGRSGPFDIVVQATSAGMTPHEDVDPLAGYRFRGSEIAYDLVYAPPRTRFLKRAEASGCRVIGGREMLICQAHAQFRLFTGHDYPTGSVDLAF